MKRVIEIKLIIDEGQVVDFEYLDDGMRCEMINCPMSQKECLEAINEILEDF